MPSTGMQANQMRSQHHFDLLVDHGLAVFQTHTARQMELLPQQGAAFLGNLDDFGQQVGESNIHLAHLAFLLEHAPLILGLFDPSWLLGIFRMKGILMVQRAIGFYWTLPVPWAGFAALPTNPDAAAKVSQTIRYQREAIQRYAKQNGHELIEESAFLEINPDRVSDQMRKTFSGLRKRLLVEGALLLVVDFADVHGWRRNTHLEWLARDADVEVVIVPPDPIMLDGKYFNPAKHFSEWREKQHAWLAGKSGRIEAAISRARELRVKGQSLPAAADQLNAEDLRSATGKPWTGDSLRKAIKAMPKHFGEGTDG